MVSVRSFTVKRRIPFVINIFGGGRGCETPSALFVTRFSFYVHIGMEERQVVCFAEIFVTIRKTCGYILRGKKENVIWRVSTMSGAGSVYVVN